MSGIKLYTEGTTPEGATFFSASQIKLYKTCKVCWAARYLDKVEQAPNAAAQRGVDIHKMLEDYLSEGKPIDPSSKYGKIALSGIEYLPSPGTCEVEDKFIFSYEDIFFRGIIDFYYKKEDLWVVGDHKTTGDFRWSLSQAALSKDLQAALYAFYIMGKTSNIQAELNWVYYLTKGAPKSKLVSGILSLTDAQYTVSLVLDDCREMLDAKARGLSALDFKPPIQGCKGFGPCAASFIGNPILRDPKMSTEKKSLKDFLDKQAPSTPPTKATAIVESLTPDSDNILTEAAMGSIEEEVEQAMADVEGIDTSALPTNGWTLLIDCLPRKQTENIVELSDILKPVFKRIAKEYNVIHPSFIPYEGTAVLVTRLDKYLTDHPIANGSIVLINLSSADARNTLDVLINHATRVYQGTRG